MPNAQTKFVHWAFAIIRLDRIVHPPNCGLAALPMSVVDEIKQKLDIVDLVSQTVKLRKSGRSYAGLCPFHSNTRTPAFYVFPETQTWHCFGACGMGGDIFTFVMKKDNVDFGDAMRLLAERAGVITAP